VWFVRSPSIFLFFLPPPHTTIALDLAAFVFPRGDSGDAAAGGQNLPMPLHHAIFALDFFASKSCVFACTTRR
jgi:hypothetical protein